MTTRTEIILTDLSKSSRIIEVGPSFNPVAPRSAGWNTVTVDHLTRQGLVEKYAGHPDVDVTKIEDVDFVWQEGALSDVVPSNQHGTFDALIASHVIEHTPDLIGFLQAAERLLAQEGKIILSIPDKRFCFDYFQSITTTGQVVNAHAHQRSVHSGEHAFDHFAYAVTDGGVESWSERPSAGLKFVHGLDDAYRNFRLYEYSEHYLDLHAWHFVPSSFELILFELRLMEKVGLEIINSVVPGGWEFFVWLHRGGTAMCGNLSNQEIDARRMRLLKRVLLEQQAQIDWLLASEPDLPREEGGLSTWATPIRYERVKAEADVLRDQLAVALRDRDVARDHVSKLERSTSWRITGPIRAFTDRIRRG